MNNNTAILNLAVNVRNRPWAAAGDGIADDTGPLQAACDYVAGEGGGTVLLPSGVYSTSKPFGWTADNVYLLGDGGARVVPSAGFAGEAVVLVGRGSLTSNMLLHGGIANIVVDVSLTQDPALTGVKLIQVLGTRIDGLRISGPKGLAAVRQTAFEISAGSLPGSAPLANWSSNVDVRGLQVEGSFRMAIRHSSGVADSPTKAQVNGTVYWGGYAFGAGKDRQGAVGASFETGDTTAVYRFAVEDFETGCYVGTQNEGPLDFRFEDVAARFRYAVGITATMPGTVVAK